MTKEQSGLGQHEQTIVYTTEMYQNCYGHVMKEGGIQ